MMTTIPADATRLRDAVTFVAGQDTGALLSLLLPGLDALEQRALVDRCRFSHAAVLVFPPSADALRDTLSACGLDADVEPQPSVVVRDRLAVRYGRDAAELDVRILRPPVLGPDGEPRTVEVFALTVPPGSALAAIAERERVAQHEAHLAFEVDRPDPLVLRGMRAVFARHGAAADGGGYNPHEDGTVFYFAAPAEAKAGYGRVELYVPGDHREVLAEHRGPVRRIFPDQPAASGAVPRKAEGRPRTGRTWPGPTTQRGAVPDAVGQGRSAGQALDEHRVRRPAETLLRLLTGAWTTQALATFARLRVPDAMANGVGLGAEALAREVGAEPGSLSRLLRFLATLDVVTEGPDGFRLTEVGALLRSEEAGSMRPLALLYGGPFYRSFGALGHTVRTGEVAFEHVFGENHFDHFARDPELAELFDRSMAASSRMFEPLAAHPVITAAGEAAGAAPVGATVVDVAGGNGELLGRLLAAHPRLRGVLVERPHSVEAARRSLDAAGCGDRCEQVAGDFADVPAGGDVYVLSRVLHDWDDDRCREILGHCARAMSADADLLVVERLLPTDGSPSLAPAWDLHMMCNVGGRERTADHYARLLASAGLTLVDHRPLPLDAYVLHARRA